MKSNYFTLVILFFASISQSCDNRTAEDSNLRMQCDQQVIIDNSQYLNAVSSAFTISNAMITDDCLTLSITASGCDGVDWTVELYDSNEILTASDGDTNPRRMLKLVLQNPELCTAVIEKDYSFDISNIQYSNLVYLIINDWNYEILYNFD